VDAALGQEKTARCSSLINWARMVPNQRVDIDIHVTTNAQGSDRKCLSDYDQLFLSLPDLETPGHPPWGLCPPPRLR